MADRTVLITTSYLEPGDTVHTRLIEAGCEVRFSRPQDREESGETLSAALEGVRGVIAGTDPFTSDVIEGATELEIIARTGAGYDSVDLEAARRRGITVCHTPGANGQSVAELTIGLLLACARHIVPGVNDVRSGHWRQRNGRELAGSTLGIIGLGAIGKRVAALAVALGMRVLVHDPAIDKAFAASIGAEGRSLPDLLAESDFVTLHIALTPQTHHLIDAAAMEAMKPTAYLINTARGGVVDDRALASVLRAGRLAGAALDVLEKEPMATDDPLREAPNVLVTPHIAGATTQARTQSSTLAVNQVVDFLDGRLVPHRVTAPAAGPVQA